MINITINKLQVTNELLKSAFEQFGAVERAVVICDSKGRSTCKGTVDFARKSSALKAVTQCNVSCSNGLKIWLY